MASVTVLIFHRPPSSDDGPLTRALGEVRERLLAAHQEMFLIAGAAAVRVIDEWRPGKTFGEVLADEAPARGGLVVLSSGAVPLLRRADAQRLIAAAGAHERQALTNNRYSSDVCAVSAAAVLRDLPSLPSDNALPRWLEERAGYAVSELPSRDRLAVDLDTPLDVAIAGLAPSCPAWLRHEARRHEFEVPRRDEMRSLAANPHGEMLVFGRAGSRTLGWLERNVRCRVRFLAEERGMRASSPSAIGGSEKPHARQRRPLSTLGLLLVRDGPASLVNHVTGLSDGAILDSRVLIAQRFGADEDRWPQAEDRYASDLLRSESIADDWLRELTIAASSAAIPILLGGHSLVGPGIPLVIGRS